MTKDKSMLIIKISYLLNIAEPNIHQLQIDWTQNSPSMQPENLYDGTQTRKKMNNISSFLRSKKKKKKNQKPKLVHIIIYSNT